MRSVHDTEAVYEAHAQEADLMRRRRKEIEHMELAAEASRARSQGIATTRREDDGVVAGHFHRQRHAELEAERKRERDLQDLHRMHAELGAQREQHLLTKAEASLQRFPKKENLAFGYMGARSAAPPAYPGRVTTAAPAAAPRVMPASSPRISARSTPFDDYAEFL